MAPESIKTLWNGALGEVCPYGLVSFPRDYPQFRMPVVMSLPAGAPADKIQLLLSGSK